LAVLRNISSDTGSVQYTSTSIFEYIFQEIQPLTLKKYIILRV